MRAIPGMTRRELLRAGLASAASMALPASGQAAPSRAANAVISICLEGGLSHLDSFDPKPDAPREIRGPFSAIRTRVPGVYFTELWPKLARIADRLTVVRSLTHDLLAHERAADTMQTILPGTAQEQWLGATPASFCGRAAMSAFYSATSARPRTKTRGRGTLLDEAYGSSEIGQHLLAARCHVERCASFVSVVDCGWDMHGDLEAGMRRRAPAVDQAVAALILDLAARGLLDRTLVVLWTEFGRTPQMNADAGREHWSRVFSMVLVGGGMAGGQVIGASDASGREPRDRPLTPSTLGQLLSPTLASFRQA